MLIVAPTTTTIRTYAQVAFFAPAQITRGEARFPGFAQTARELSCHLSAGVQGFTHAPLDRSHRP